ncbi:MAG TPA: hypothetical protein VNX29_01845 [Kaistia sp.]|nr:hypothetical protein [Kaistia sp.]
MSNKSVWEWSANMGGSTTKPMLRMRDHPKVQELQRKLLLFYNPAHPLSPELETLIESVSRALFKIDRVATVIDEPERVDLPTREQMDAYWRARDLFESHEAQFDELYGGSDTLVILRRLGLDFSDASGNPLNCLRFLDRQAFAAAKGICGELPDRSELATRLFEDSLQAAADEWQKKRRDRPRPG